VPAALYPPPGRFLVLISVRGWVDPRAIVRLEGLVNWKIQWPHRESNLQPCTLQKFHKMHIRLLQNYQEQNLIRYCRLINIRMFYTNQNAGCLRKNKWEEYRRQKCVFWERSQRQRTSKASDLTHQHNTINKVFENKCIARLVWMPGKWAVSVKTEGHRNVDYYEWRKSDSLGIVIELIIIHHTINYRWKWILASTYARKCRRHRNLFSPKRHSLSCLARYELRQYFYVVIARPSSKAESLQF
jgi:hypothetical protein